MSPQVLCRARHQNHGLWLNVLWPAGAACQEWDGVLRCSLPGKRICIPPAQLSLQEGAGPGSGSPPWRLGLPVRQCRIYTHRRSKKVETDARHKAPLQVQYRAYSGTALRVLCCVGALCIGFDSAAKNQRQNGSSSAAAVGPANGFPSHTKAADLHAVMHRACGAWLPSEECAPGAFAGEHASWLQDFRLLQTITLVPDSRLQCILPKTQGATSTSRSPNSDDSTDAGPLKQPSAPRVYEADVCIDGTPAVNEELTVRHSRSLAQHPVDGTRPGISWISN